MLQTHSRSYVLVIVPTLALGQEHLDTLTKLEIYSVFLSSSSTKVDQIVSLLESSTSTVPAVVILTPETLFGNGLYSSGPRSGRLAKWEIFQSGTGWSLHQKDPSSPIFFDLAREV
jgi:hypothetical protein